VAGGLTAIGPILGGVLSEWTWRSIFWVNVPVAVIALVLTARARPHTETRPGTVDFRGLTLAVLGVGLGVFGLQQSQIWGWGNPAIASSIAVGIVLLVVFTLVELRTAQPLVQVRMFTIRAFLVENIVLFFAMACFLPVFFFASVYAQAALGYGPNEAGLFLLTFFAGFAPGVQVGGRILDRRGAKQVVVAGSAIAIVGLMLWAGQVTELRYGTQWFFVVLSGFGFGLLVGPANTDAINQVPRQSFGEATGVTQTMRNYGGSVGLAALGTLFTATIASKVTSELIERAHLPRAKAAQIAKTASQSQFGSANGISGHSSPQALSIAHDAVAYATRDVLYGMAVAMAVAFLAALIGLRRGIHHADEEGQSGPTDYNQQSPVDAAS
jgi:MFS family permease